MKRLLLIVLPLLLIVGCSEVEGQQQLIPNITERYENGGIKSIYYYKKTRNKIEVVKYEEYYNYGQMEEESHFKDGERIGLRTWWYANGKKKSEGTYKDGEKDGKWTEWYDNGQKKREGTYKDGKKISWKRWNRDGSVRDSS